jgi:2-amino-4-hydroxy-6-hydroxymethyldihydropteridine diphosphokinase
VRAWIGLGSNVGERRKQIHAAAAQMAPLLANLRLSRLIETAALDRDGNPAPDSPAYVNAVAVGETSLTPRELFARLLEIERCMGRPAAEKSLYLPRTIDLDILMLENAGGAIVVNDPDLIVPHPRLQDRPFLLELMAEITQTAG